MASVVAMQGTLMSERPTAQRHNANANSDGQNGRVRVVTLPHRLACCRLLLHLTRRLFA